MHHTTKKQHQNRCSRRRLRRRGRIDQFGLWPGVCPLRTHAFAKHRGGDGGAKQTTNRAAVSSHRKIHMPPRLKAAETSGNSSAAAAAAFSANTATNNTTFYGISTTSATALNVLHELYIGRCFRDKLNKCSEAFGIGIFKHNEV